MKKCVMSGFSLIELLLTMVVIGILSMIAVPAYLNYVEEGKIRSVALKMMQLSTEASLFYQKYKNYSNFCTDYNDFILKVESQFDSFDLTCTSNTTEYTITAEGKNSLAGLTFESSSRWGRRTTAIPADWTPCPGTVDGYLISKKSGTCL